MIGGFNNRPNYTEAEARAFYAERKRSAWRSMTPEQREATIREEREIEQKKALAAAKVEQMRPFLPAIEALATSMAFGRIEISPHTFEFFCRNQGIPDDIIEVVKDELVRKINYECGGEGAKIEGFNFFSKIAPKNFPRGRSTLSPQPLTPDEYMRIMP